MLIKVATKDLKMGMFVADVGRSWFNHPWKTKSRLLSSTEEIRQLIEFGITEVYVDTEKSTTDSELKKEEPAPKAPPAPIKKITPKPQTHLSPEPVCQAELEMPQASKAYHKALDTSKALLAACRMNKKIEMGAVRENVDELVDSVYRNHDALIALMKLRRFDDYTYTHSLNVSVLAISTGKTLGLGKEELTILGMGTMFHDLGKSKIPGYILNKPSKLTDDEFEIMRDHATMSARIILDQKLAVDDLVIKVAKHHHERMDGSGYPDHLEGDAIPSLVTICGLADVYDALTSDRVYHKGRPPHEALRMIYGMRGTHFPPEWVDRFVQSVGIYPPGSVVETASGHIAVVMGVNQEALNAPLIKVVADPKGQLYPRPKVMDLSQVDNPGDWTIRRIIPKTEAGFEPSYYFNPPK